MAERCPLFVELCAGTAAVSLQLHAGKHARPPVSRMGSKRGYAHAVLRVLGLRPGQGRTDRTRYLWCEPDAGVRLLLHAYTDRELAQEAAAIIRGWADEEPRALWERLRSEGPAQCPDGVSAREVAKFLRLLSSNRLIPATWSTDGRWVNTARDGGPGTVGGCSFGGADFCTGIEQLAESVLDCPAVPATIAPDARKVDPREVARWCSIAQRSIYNGKHSGPCFVPPEPVGGGHTRYALASPAPAIEQTPNLPATITPDARTIHPPEMPPGVVAYMDPPYQNTTKYAHDLPRSEVVDLARRWQSAGATVCISEAEPIPELVADGWHAVDITNTRKGQRRTFSKQQAEWLTLSREPAWRPSVQGSLFGWQ